MPTENETQADTAKKILCNNGPQPHSKIGNIGPKLRQDGVKKFNINVGMCGSSPTVYYIEKKHKPKAVIQTWLDEHRMAKNEFSAASIHQKISKFGDQWKEASRELFGPHKRPTGNTDPDPDQGGICPLCKNNFDYTLPKHLQECDESQVG